MTSQCVFCCYDKHQRQLGEERDNYVFQVRVHNQETLQQELGEGTWMQEPKQNHGETLPIVLFSSARSACFFKYNPKPPARGTIVHSGLLFVNHINSY